MNETAKVKFFKSPDQFRRWLGANHATATELWVGFHKKDSGRPSMTWPESVDQALCFGWIDGLRKSIDETSYRIRFSPRKPRSIWSNVNINRALELISLGLIEPMGLKAFEARLENRSGIYSYEQRSPELPEPYSTRFKTKPDAWRFYEAQSPSYRRTLNWWILSPKKEETRLKRLSTLIEACGNGTRLR